MHAEKSSYFGIICLKLVIISLFLYHTQSLVFDNNLISSPISFCVAIAIDILWGFNFFPN